MDKLLHWCNLIHWAIQTYLENYDYDKNSFFPVREYHDVKAITSIMACMLNNKTAYRTNMLGLLPLNNILFESYGSYKGIALGAPTEYHDLTRPFLDKIYGDTMISSSKFINRNNRG